MPRNYSTNGVAWTKAKTLEAKARTSLLQLQHEKESGELWEANAVRDYFGRVLGSMKSQLMELGPNLAARVNPADPVLASSTISDAVTRILATAADQVQSFIPKPDGKRGRQRAKMGKAR